MYLRVACPLPQLLQLRTSPRTNMCVDVVAAVVVMLELSLLSSCPPPQFSLPLSLSLVLLQALLMHWLHWVTRQMCKSHKGTPKGGERGRMEGGWEWKYVCVCVWQHVCGIRFEQSEHVLARGEKLLIQLVAAKALSPLSSSVCRSLSKSLSYSASLSLPLSPFYSHILFTGHFT